MPASPARLSDCATYQFDGTHNTTANIKSVYDDAHVLLYPLDMPSREEQQAAAARAE